MTRERIYSRPRLPAAVSAIVDRLAGRRRVRKAQNANATCDRALLERQKVAFARTAGILKDMDIPDWETPEKTSAWVRRLRAVDSEATESELSSNPTPCRYTCLTPTP